MSFAGICTFGGDNRETEEYINAVKDASKFAFCVIRDWR